MTNDQSTPRPWSIVEINNGKDIQIDSDKLHICNITRYGQEVGIHEKANAKIIVKAVNSYDYSIALAQAVIKLDVSESLHLMAYKILHSKG